MNLWKIIFIFTKRIAHYMPYNNLAGVDLFLSFFAFLFQEIFLSWNL